MPGNTTAGSTLLDEELHRILVQREQECTKLQLRAMNSTPPPGRTFNMHEYLTNLWNSYFVGGYPVDSVYHAAMALEAKKVDQFWYRFVKKYRYKDV